MKPSLADMQSFVERQHREAKKASNDIPFPTASLSLSEGKRAGALQANASITDVERYRVLKHSTGCLAWAVVLAVDLRRSSKRALEVGPYKTYLTMHTYLPTMAHLVESYDGNVIGLRGDGLFAGFEVTEKKRRDSNDDVTQEVGERAAQNAVTCGKAMIEAIEDAVNPVLDNDDIPGDLEIGIGVAVGDVVITRIGWDSANELTAYGDPVNQACKQLATGRNGIQITKGVKQIFPTSKRGRVKFNLFSGNYTVVFPSDMHMLSR